MRRQYTEEEQVDVLDMLDGGTPTHEVASYFGIPLGTVKSWREKRDKAQRGEEDDLRPLYRTMPTMGRLRTAFRMMAYGVSLRRIEAHIGIDRKQLVKFAQDKRVVEATYEFDERVPYDYDNLLDRATVAHQLCTETFDLTERANIVLAIIFPKEVRQ